VVDDERDDRRSDARERALGLLYEGDAKSLDGTQVLAALPVAPDPLATLLVQGVTDHLVRIDELIVAHARGWTIDRMPVIDRSVLRIAIFELLERPDVPTPVIIDEAVRLAKRFSTDDSGRFVNGMLSTIAAKLRPPAG
jgi:N utilization substance protein B